MTMVISGDGSITGLVAGGLPDATVTGAELSGAQTGNAPIYGCRAWCVFNGVTTGTNAPTAGGNVSTVTRNSAGSYTINFTTAMPDATYAVALSGVNVAQTETFGVSAQTTTSVTIINGRSGVGPTDTSAFTGVAIFR